MKLRHFSLLALFLYGFTLVGCGQKGPLYLPDKQTAPVLKKTEADTTKENPTSSTSEETETTEVSP